VPRSDVREVLAPSALVLQLSSKAEAFGRTVLEALSLGRPVLGFDHGGVGEQLRQFFPEGAVPVGDMTRLAVRAIELLRFPQRLPPIAGPTRAAMQAQTLALYAAVCGDGRQVLGHG